MTHSFARRSLCAAALAALGALATVPLGAMAQSYPTKPITIIAPFAAGASSDGIARVVARELSQLLRQSVVVENKPGGGGATGLLVVANAAPDGYTIGMGAAGAVVIGPNLPDAAPLNPGKQLQPLAKVADIPLILVASGASGYDSLQSLLNKARTTEVPMGNSGQYTAHHLAVELLATSAKVKLSAVPYRGSAPATSDVVGGQIPTAIVDLTSAVPHIKAGTVKALAVTSAQRSKLAPDVPTMAEAGVPGYAATGWIGMFAPKGVPPAIVDRLAKAIKTVLDKADVQAQILNLSSELAYLDPQQFQAFMDTESSRWAKVIAGLPKPK